tara:strand:+ start:3055 stop:3234 length:180 start_codon:yes stop_codon:yes gene_type:complete
MKTEYTIKKMIKENSFKIQEYSNILQDLKNNNREDLTGIENDLNFLKGWQDALMWTLGQ